MELNSQMHSGRSTPPEDLRAYLMNPNIPKSEAEHWAARRITELEEALSRPMEAGAWREKLADAAYVVLRHSDYRPGTDNGLIPHDDRLVPLAIADVILALIATQPAD